MFMICLNFGKREVWFGLIYTEACFKPCLSFVFLHLLQAVPQLSLREYILYYSPYMTMRMYLVKIEAVPVVLREQVC